MKKIIISAAVIIVFVSFIIFERNSSQATTVPESKSGNSNTIVDNSTGDFKNGSYTGTAADAFYGTVQVKAVVQNGKLADVQFLQYPDKPGHTIEVNNSAIPVLKQEAISAQSAHVAIISGATQTSQAFMQSLADALSQAK